jgi:hypothetical protein
VLLLIVSHLRWGVVGGDHGLWWALEAPVKRVLAAGMLEGVHSLIGLTDKKAGPPLLLGKSQWYIRTTNYTQRSSGAEEQRGRGVEEHRDIGA